MDHNLEQRLLRRKELGQERQQRLTFAQTEARQQLHKVSSLLRQLANNSAVPTSEQDKLRLAAEVVSEVRL